MNEKQLLEFIDKNTKDFKKLTNDQCKQKLKALMEVAKTMTKNGNSNQ